MTAQRHEKLILNGEETSMAYVPSLPEGDSRIVAVPEDFITWTDCWRGYVGTWEIRDEKFYLKDLNGGLRLDSDTPILADWFSGVLRVPRGERLHYVHMGFGSLYEEELHIKVVQGVVVITKVISNKRRWLKRFLGKRKLNLRSYPGLENRFDGDDL